MMMIKLMRQEGGASHWKWSWSVLYKKRKQLLPRNKGYQLINAIFRVWITQNARATSHAKFQQKEKFFAGEKSSIPTKFFWYTKMTPVNLAGLQI